MKCKKTIKIGAAFDKLWSQPGKFLGANGPYDVEPVQTAAQNDDNKACVPGRTGQRDGRNKWASRQ